MSKNIVFVCDHLKGGGAERINLEMAKKFSSVGYAVTFLLLDGDNIGFAVPENIKVINLNIKFQNSLFRRRGKVIKKKDKELIKKIEIELEPSLIVIGFALGCWLAKCFTSQNIWLWIHGELTCFDIQNRSYNNCISYFNEKRRICLEKKVFYKIFEKMNVIVVNEELINFYRKYSNPKSIHFVPNGYQKENIYNIDFNRKEIDVLYLGRLSAEKQVHIAIKAFLDSGIEGKMTIIGDGPLRQSLEEMVKDLNVSDRIIFLGWKSNVEEFIIRSCVLPLTSKTEGFPMVITEAISLGTPVVTYNSSKGIEYQLATGDLKKGLVELNNYNKLVDTLKNVYENPYNITDQDKNRLSLDLAFSKFLDLTLPN